MKSGYELNYRRLVAGLVNCDFEDAALRLGLEAPVNGALTIAYLGRTYTVTKSGVFPVDGLPSDPNDRSILIHYITSRGSGEAEQEYYLLHHFARSVLAGGDSSLFSGRVREGALDLASMRRAMDVLGACYHGNLRSGEYVWHYRILPKMPIEVIYYEADDEFPCDIKIKFDGSADRFMGFETLAFVCGSFIGGLLRVGQNT